MIRSLLVDNESRALFEGKSSNFYPQLSRRLLTTVLHRRHCFLISTHGLLGEIEKCPEVGVKVSDNTMSSLSSANDFVGIAETGSVLQSLIDAAHNHSRHWQFEAYAKKCAVVIFSHSGTLLANGFGMTNAYPF